MDKKQTKKPYFTFFLGLICLIIAFFAYANHASASYQSEGTGFYAPSASSGYATEGIAFYAFQSQATDSLPVYHFYNSTTSDNFYTISETEKSKLIDNAQSGYSYVDIAFYSFKTQATDSLPIYRFYNRTTGDHFYTASENEKNKLVSNPQWGYAYENVAFYAFTSQITDSSPVYRFYNRTTGDHFYTASESEKGKISSLPVYRFFNITIGDHLYTTTNTAPSGYAAEGIAFYAFQSQATDSLPVYHFYNSTTSDNFYTISETEKNKLIDNAQSGYSYEDIAFYSLPAQIGNSVPVYRLYNPTNGDHFYTISETERNNFLLQALGPDISVGVWSYSRSALQSSAFEIEANESYNIKDRYGKLVATLPGSALTKVKYTSDGKLRIYNSIAEKIVSKEVVFAPTNANSTTMIFNAHRPDSTYDEYRGKIKVRYGDTSKLIWVINILPLEHYIWGIGEITGTGDEDYNRTMTTAFRTYGYWKVLYSTKYALDGFKVDATPSSQIYRGYEWEVAYPRVKAAAIYTQGKIAKYGSDIALTPYSSWTDGRTRSFQERWGGTNYPWCQSVADPYGKHATLTTAQLVAAGNHMVGISAHGALKLATTYNWAWDKILKYYLTGITITKIY